jgi:HSP20 family protein
MVEEDTWSRWNKKPFFRSSFLDMGEIFRDMEAMMENEFRRLTTNAPRELVRERTLPDGTKVHEWGPFVYGYSMTLGPDGKPKVREFGNVKPHTTRGVPHIDVKENREPLADVIDAKEKVRVVVELPGVEKKDIKLHGTDHTLTISVDSPQRKYYKEVQLPGKVKVKEVKSSYKNGVLDITLPKTKPEKPKPKGTQINIE